MQREGKSQTYYNYGKYSISNSILVVALFSLFHFHTVICCLCIQLIDLGCEITQAHPKHIPVMS